jgi:hypothetical protein
MDQLYDLAVRDSNNSISREEGILELRGGGLLNWAGALGIIVGIIITLITNVAAFQVPPNPFVPPHRQ